MNADRIFWFSVPAKADSSNYFRDFFSKYFQNGDRQTARCVVGSITDSDIRLLADDPDFLPPGKCQMGLLKPT